MKYEEKIFKNAKEPIFKRKKCLLLLKKDFLELKDIEVEIKREIK